jgi:AcrR family transcriptional regulator
MDPEKRRATILQAAKKVFAEKGYHNAGVADIIESAGIARGTFYLYFKSKTGVFSALMEYILQSIDELLVPVDWDNQDAILDVLRQNLSRVQDLFVNDPDILKIIVEQAMALDAESREGLAAMEQLLLQWMSNLVREARDRSILKPIDPDVCAVAFLGSIKQVFQNVVLTGQLSPDGPATMGQILELYMFGLILPEYTEKAQTLLTDIQTEERHEAVKH